MNLINQMGFKIKKNQVLCLKELKHNKLFKPKFVEEEYNDSLLQANSSGDDDDGVINIKKMMDI